MPDLTPEPSLPTQDGVQTPPAPPQPAKKPRKKDGRTPANHPFGWLKKKKPKPTPSGTILKNEVETVISESRTRARVTPDDGKLQVLPSADPFLEELQVKIPLKRALDKLNDLMDAQTSFYDLTSGQVMTRPDGPTQLKAVALHLSYWIGSPVQRQIIEHHHIDSLDELEKKLATNPALCESLLKLITQAQAKQASEQT